ncbi:MAG: pyridoxal phosphate-dependent aminotransferase [Bacteroidales bacterium]
MSNPTEVGLDYPARLLAPLADPASLAYAPHPFGLPSARQAAAADFARRGVQVPEGRVVLTASTSEAYSFLFKLLCDPGDAVLVPRPSYPLFDHLTELDAVEARPYALDYHGRWSVDFDSLDRALTPRTRAVLVVSPNNPTGSFLSARDLPRLAAFCAEHRLAVVGDEVFADYAFDGVSAPPSVLSIDDTLAFGLGGLSKSAGLPQLKLGWIGVSGPDGLVAEALGRLEVICDSYLSVGTPVQRAAGALIADADRMRGQIRARVQRNFATLRRVAADYPSCEALPIEGGWSAVLRVPATTSEEDLVVGLLEDDGVVVYPGFFFDFAHEAFLVASLLPQPEVFEPAVRRVLERCA